MINLEQVSSIMQGKPSHILTLNDNERSRNVIEIIREILKERHVTSTIEIRTVDQDELMQILHNLSSPERVIALYDDDRVQSFRPDPWIRGSRCRPPWAQGINFAFRIGASCKMNGSRARNCAQELIAFFVETRPRSKNAYPWGKAPRSEIYAESMQARVCNNTSHGGNGKPDLTDTLAGAIAQIEIPNGTPIDRVQILPHPISVNKHTLQSIQRALGKFEQASQELVENENSVRHVLLSGAFLSTRLHDAYLHPSTARNHFRRIDVHQIPDGRTLVTNWDDAPLSLAEAYVHDMHYRINQEQWRDVFSSIATEQVVFLVSEDRWEKYAKQAGWIVGQMRERGLQATILSTKQLGKIVSRAGYLSCGGKKVSTIWCLFPLQETPEGMSVVLNAAKRGMVNLVPRFGCYSNSAWPALFRKFASFFKENLEEQDFTILNQCLPHAHIIQSENEFPLEIKGIALKDLQSLCNLPLPARSCFVLQSIANWQDTLIGSDSSSDEWYAWVYRHKIARQPFVIREAIANQCRTPPCCRALIRPHFVDETLFTAPVYVVLASNTPRTETHVAISASTLT